MVMHGSAYTESRDWPIGARHRTIHPTHVTITERQTTWTHTPGDTITGRIALDCIQLTLDVHLTQWQADAITALFDNPHPRRDLTASAPPSTGDTACYWCDDYREHLGITHHTEPYDCIACHLPAGCNHHRIY